MTTHMRHLSILSPSRFTRRQALAVVAGLLLLTLAALSARGAMVLELFESSETCLACHNGLVAPDGLDVSFGLDWRSSMMANAARDPYWHAAVRREILDHPEAAAAIEDECAACHMPMSRTEAHAAGGKGRVLAHLAAPAAGRATRLAQDGVSCAACHRIGPRGLGTRKSFSGGYVVEVPAARAAGGVFGPFSVSPGLTRVMQSATGFEPRQGTHVQRAELCAACHTLFTQALGPGGRPLGTLPEQVPYLEWKHSDYHEAQTCQDCHMPALDAPMPIASVLGEPRQKVARHVFRGGNILMPRILNRHRAELGVQALPQELDAMVRRTTDHLQREAAELTLERIRIGGGALQAEVVVQNRAGHKLPTAYPSRRAWLHLTVTDAGGKMVFESGAITAEGAIRGNDNDADPGRFEPHHDMVDAPDKVPIFEPILADHKGRVTTGLLAAVRYVKDNRLLPEGFDKARAGTEIAVQGAAMQDRTFTAGGDRVHYRVRLGGSSGPYTITVELLYQPIGYRWAHNLGSLGADEPRRFLRYYSSMAPSSAVMLARASATAQPEPPPSPPPPPPSPTSP